MSDEDKVDGGTRLETGEGGRASITSLSLSAASSPLQVGPADKQTINKYRDSAELQWQFVTPEISGGSKENSHKVGAMTDSLRFLPGL